MVPWECSKMKLVQASSCWSRGLTPIHEVVVCAFRNLFKIRLGANMVLALRSIGMILTRGTIELILGGGNLLLVSYNIIGTRTHL